MKLQVAPWCEFVTHQEITAEEATLNEETTYLARYPDVAEAVRAGSVASGLEHYLRYGRREGRRWPTVIPLPASGSAPGVPPSARGIVSRDGLTAVAHRCEVAFVAPGFLFAYGWIDDRADPLTALEIAVGDGHPIERCTPYRYRRTDVESHLGSYPFEAGFWVLMSCPRVAPSSWPTLGLRFASGQTLRLTPAKGIPCGLGGMLEAFLHFHGQRHVIGDPIARSFKEFDGGLAPVVARIHSEIRATYAMRGEGNYGRLGSPVLSFVSCIHGIPDFLFLQIAGFARYGALDAVEFIYVNNSPELEETLHRDAEIAAYLFGASVRVLSLNQNTGFSFASNAGVAHARADTIVLINPDVFPKGARSLDGLLALKGERRKHSLTGAKLFYANGSVMHEGMYFVTDSRLSALSGSRVWTVEHLRKGFPERRDRRPHEVAAVSGALMVIERTDFENVGGFDEKFIYGHYEDADLCLRLAQHRAKIIYDPRLPFWHYEGIGSSAHPEQAGASHYNRWLFSRRWSDRLSRRSAKD